MTDAAPPKARPARSRAADDRDTRGARARVDRRLTRESWIGAGQDILRKDGISAVKLAPLTRRLGVSTGSFYHHFADFEEYLGELAASYSMGRVRGVLDRTSFDDPDPTTRVRELARLSVVEGTFDLDRAMRIWAAMDPRAAATVQEAEAQVLAFLSDAFHDLGFDRTQAELRSRILMSVNIAQLQLFDSGGRRRFFKEAFDLLASGADGGGNAAGKINV